MTKILLSRWAFAVLATALALAAIILAVTPTAPRASAAPPAAPGDQAKLTASDRAVDDFFGSTVAISGDTALVGAPQKFGVGEKGSAYVFVGSGTAWNQQDQLAPSDGEVDDRFGFSVAVSGETAVVGASNDDGKGSVYVFVRSGGTWSQQAKLTASDGVPGSLDNFGADVAISGNTVVVGAQFNNGARGAAYVFVRSGSTWSQQAKLTASDATPIDVFGASVSISGNTVVVGAFLDDDKGTDSGSAYIFVRSGTTWSRQAKVKASDGASGDLFGISVGVSGETVVVGSYLDDARGDNSGSAYVFKRDGTTWSQQAKFNAIDAASGDLFGTSVAVSGDTAVVGAVFRDSILRGSNSGAAYVFKRIGTTWTQQAQLTASDGASGDLFGTSVAVSGDTAVVGASDDDNNRGSAHTFDLPAPGFDTDGDGIRDGVDGFFFFGGIVDLRSIPSIRFTDQHLGGKSFGEIIDRDGLIITVVDALFPGGFLISASGGGGGTATIDVCGDPQATLLLTNGASATLSCGSVIAEVHVGPITLFVGDDTVVDVPTGTTVTITELGEEQFLIENSAESEGEVTVWVNGQPTLIAPGDTTTTGATNAPPIAIAGGPYEANEGSSVTLDGSSSFDLDGSISSYEWDLDNDGVYGDAAGVTAAITFSDNGTFTVGLRVTDDLGATDTDTAEVLAHNVAPSVGVIAGPLDPVQVGTTVNVGSSFTDPGTLDTHDAVWDWGDGSASACPANSSECTLDQSNGSVSGSHIYTIPGVYTVSLTVTDDDGGSSDSIFQSVVVNVIGPTAEPSFGLLLDPADNAVGVKVDVTRVTSPVTGSGVSVPLGSFQAQLTYDSSCVNLLDIREMDFSIAAKNITNGVTGSATFNGFSASGVIPPADLGFAVTRLVGGNQQSCSLTMGITSLADEAGNAIGVSNALTQMLQRGDARADGTINIADALFIAQHLVGLRPACTHVVDNSCLHLVNAASVRQDGPVDRMTIADALFIAQYLVGLRDKFFLGVP